MEPVVKRADEKDVAQNLEDDVKGKIIKKIADKDCCRDNVVMTRLDDDVLELIEALVEVDVFKSKSEAVAFFVKEGMQARKELFEAVMPTVMKIHQLKEEVRRSLDQEVGVSGKTD
jgi:Arc/MetJ-type ribon-helix-helix transcriptional regulator